MNKIPKIYTLGTRFNRDIFTGSVIVEEKIDGSQFQFGIENGVLVCRSKGQVIDQSAPGMFDKAVETVQKLAPNLLEGFVFQCEYLQRPKHNVLAYARVPKNHLVLFDVKIPGGAFTTDPGLKRGWAHTLDLEAVPVLHSGRLPPTQEWLAAFLDAPSVLGNCKVEGIVIKNYSLPHPESESETAPMTAKVVSDAFKEKASCASPINPSSAGDLNQKLINALRTESRWLKAIQHLREAGQLQGDPKDIGPLVKEIQRDALEEEADWIKQQLFDSVQHDIGRGIVQGFAQFYKSLLAGNTSVYQQMLLNEQQH
jgi:hypothetical protein